MSFGALVKALRIAQKKTLRQFCLEHGVDASNWSKVERGVNPPSKDQDTLDQMATWLGLNEGTEEWQKFMDQADIARGRIPKDMLSDEALLEKLPVFFRTIRGAEMSGEKLDEFIEDVRRLYSPDEESDSIQTR